MDTQVLLWTKRHAAPSLTEAMRVATAFGDGLTLTAVCGAASVASWVNGHRRAALFMATAAVGAGLLCNVLKLLFERERPSEVFRLVSASSYSFPSGHSMASASSYGALAIVLGRSHRNWRHVVVALAILIVLSVGVSRVYLRVHYVTDVLAGWLLGLSWLVVTKAALYRKPFLHG
jgi:undecaprenyl-diphosphatase